VTLNDIEKKQNKIKEMQNYRDAKTKRLTTTENGNLKETRDNLKETQDNYKETAWHQIERKLQGEAK